MSAQQSGQALSSPPPRPPPAPHSRRPFSSPSFFLPPTQYLTFRHMPFPTLCYCISISVQSDFGPDIFDWIYFIFGVTKVCSSRIGRVRRWPLRPLPLCPLCSKWPLCYFGFPRLTFQQSHSDDEDECRESHRFCARAACSDRVSLVPLFILSISMHARE